KVGDVRLTGSAQFALEISSVLADVDGAGAGPLVDARVLQFALTVSELGVYVKDTASLKVSGQLALASVKPTAVADTRSWTALKMGSVVVTGDVRLGLTELTAQITVDALDVNLASATAPTVVPARLDWTKAFDLDGDGQFDDQLNPGALLPTPVMLAIDYAASLQVRVRGTLTGTGSTGGVNTWDVNLDGDTADGAADALSNVLLSVGDVRLT